VTMDLSDVKTDAADVSGHLAPRSIEEGFLDCVARLVRRNERGRKNRATPVGMKI
jgi:hypothetical protein